MKEQDLKHGAKHQPIRRWFHRKWRKHISGRSVARGAGVDYSAGSQYRPMFLGKLPHKNQGQNSSCGGQAGSEFLQLKRIMQGINEGEISAKSIYAPIADSGGGTTIPQLQRQIEDCGGNLESAVPSYDSQGNPLPENLMEDISWQTPALIADALTRAGYVSIDVDMNDMDAVAEAINTYGVVIWKITGQNGNPLGWVGATPDPPNPNNPNELWYHFMCAFDFDLDSNGEKRIYAMQSMGSSWGANGIQYFYEDYFKNGYIDPFTFEYDGNIQVPVQPPQSAWPLLGWFFAGWNAVNQWLGGLRASPVS